MDKPCTILLFIHKICVKVVKAIIDNKIDISEKIINKNLEYLNEDIKIPVFIKWK